MKQIAKEKKTVYLTKSEQFFKNFINCKSEIVFFLILKSRQFKKI